VARIAVTGGSGFVGNRAGRALVAAGHDVVMLSRGKRRTTRPDGARFARADVVDGEGLEGALTGCDAVVHLVAIIRERGKQTFDRVNRQGTDNVARAAAAAGVPHFIHLSAIGADPDPYFAYLKSKWEGEQAVSASGVPYTIIRSSLIFGPGDAFFSRLTKLVRLNPIIPIVGNGRSLFQPFANSDLSRVIVEAVARGPNNATHEVGGPEHLSYDDIIHTIREAVHARIRGQAHVPVRAMVPLAWVMDKILPNPPVTPGQLRLLEKNNITRLDAVARDWGFEPISFRTNAEYLQQA